MTSAKIKNYFLRILTGIFLVATLAAFFPFNQVHAAYPQTQQIQGGGCDGQGVVTGYRSPYSKTPDMCLGTDSSATGIQYYQFAVEFPDTITGGSVTGKSADGVTIDFVSQSNQLYVSKPTQKSAGYQADVSLTTSSCVSSNKSLQITITAKGNGNSQNLDTNLCSNVGADKSLITLQANTITGTGGATSSDTGRILGNIGIYREDPSVASSRKLGTLEQSGVVSITLSQAGANGNVVVKSGTNQDNWYALAAGKLIIGGQHGYNLPGGIYSLDIHYDDRAILQGLGGSADTTSGDMEISIANITVRPGEDTWIPKGASDSDIIYYNAEGKTVDPNNLPTTAAAKSCVIDGIGWLICSFTSFIADVADNVYSLVEDLLKVPVINTDTSGTNGVYNAWTIMRNLANVVFVIMFLIIIFAQLTGQGVSNYGVKKTLPRLIVAAVLVNVSFWLSAIVVDLSNIIGSGLYQLLRGVVNSMNVGISSNWASILGALMEGGSVAVGASTAGVAAVIGAAAIPGVGLSLLFLAIPLVLGAMLAILVVAVILVARQALVIILIIVSPLAFVALLLPNTESLFKRWRTTLTSLLLMFPIVSIIFGGAQVAGFAILSTASKPGATPTEVAIAIITSQFVIVAPFFFLPTILIRFSGGNLDKLAATIQNRGQKLIGGINNASRRAGMDRLGRGYNRAKYGHDDGGTGLRSSFRRAIGAGGRRFDQRKDGDKLTDDYLAEERQKATNTRLGTDSGYATRIAGGSASEGAQIAARAIAAAEAEAIKKSLQPLVRAINAMDPKDKDKYLADELAAGGSRAGAALHYSASIGDTSFMRKQLASSNPDIVRQAREAVTANATTLMAKAPSMVKGADAAFGSVRAEDMSTWDETTAQEFADHIDTLKGADRKNAVDAFNVAIDNLANTPALKSKFNIQTAKKLQSAIAAKPTLASTLVTKRIGAKGELL